MDTILVLLIIARASLEKACELSGDFSLPVSVKDLWADVDNAVTLINRENAGCYVDNPCPFWPECKHDYGF
jgi:hypothetical protein